MVYCIFRSLAVRYGEVLDALKELAPFDIDTLYIVGGGARNTILNSMTEEVTGVKVIAGPSEATAIGNCMLQAAGGGTGQGPERIQTYHRRNILIGKGFRRNRNVSSTESLILNRITRRTDVNHQTIRQ